MFDIIKKEMIDIFDDLYAIAQVAGGIGRLRTRDITYCDFSTCHPPTFEGRKDLIMNMLWISDMESALCKSFFPKDTKVRFDLNLL